MLVAVKVSEGLLPPGKDRMGPPTLYERLLVLGKVVAVQECLEVVAVTTQKLDVFGIIVERVPVDVVDLELTEILRIEPAPDADPSQACYLTPEPLLSGLADVSSWFSVCAHELFTVPHPKTWEVKHGGC